MVKAEVMFCLAAAIAVGAPCALADSSAHTTVAPPTFCGPPGVPPPGPPFFPPAMGFAHGGPLMWTGPGGGPPLPPPPPDMPFMMMPGMAGVDLTEQQIASMAAMQRSFRNDVEPIKSRMHQLQDALQLELYQDSVDATKVKQLQEQLQAERNQFDKVCSDHMLQMVQALTPEQRKKARQQLDQMALGPVIMRHP